MYVVHRRVAVHDAELLSGNQSHDVRMVAAALLVENRRLRRNRNRVLVGTLFYINKGVREFSVGDQHGLRETGFLGGVGTSRILTHVDQHWLRRSACEAYCAAEAAHGGGIDLLALFNDRDRSGDSGGF